MDNRFRIRTGQVVGRSHLFSRKNCQDALAFGNVNFNTDNYSIGVIADGCGEGKESEVGAKLGVNFIYSEVKRLIKIGIPQKFIPEVLFMHTTNFLERLINSFSLSDEEKITFILNHLLFTIVGYIVGPSESQIFSYGDGLVILNQEIEFRNQDDHPDYIAYHLLRNIVPSMPQKFDTFTIASKDLQRLAVGSDGWTNETDLITQGSIWDHQHPSGLQRIMNVWSEKEKRFQDDTTIITLEVIEGGKT